MVKNRLRKLNSFFKVFISDLERGLLSVQFIASVLGIFLAMLFGVANQLIPDSKAIAKGLEWQFHVKLSMDALKSEAVVFALPLLAPLPAAGACLAEQKCGFARFSLFRTGFGTYTVSKLLTTGIIGGAVPSMGALALCGIFSLLYRPLEIPSKGSLWPGLWLCILVVFAAGYLWASISMLLGLVFKNRYMALGGAFMLSYMMVILSARYLPDIYVLNPREWLLMEKFWEGENLGVAGFLFELCIISSILEAFILMKRLGKGGRI